MSISPLSKEILWLMMLSFNDLKPNDADYRTEEGGEKPGSSLELW